MSLSAERINELDALCNRFRRDVLTMLHNAQTGHPGGSLSACEILTALYFEEAKLRADEPNWPERDRIVLSKGHAAPMLYRILAEKGFFPMEEIKTFRQLDSRLQGHPNANETPGVDVTSGPLGLGLSVGIGIALGMRLSQCSSYVYVVMGDGELNEGTVWEACMAASKFSLGHLIVIVDHNHVQLDGTNDQIMPMKSLDERFKAFGLNVLSCDGHDLSALCATIDKAKAVCDRPSVIIAETVKGKGVSFMEGQNAWHGKAIDDEHFAKAMAELEGEAHE